MTAAKHPERVGSYRVSEVLGEGGVGVVYAARRDGSSTDCALKVLRHGLGGGKVLARFSREAEILRRLRHPSIAAFFEAGEAQVETEAGRATVPFLAMERVDGESLGRHARQAELDLAKRAELIARVADGLHHAHEAGVVHRDLKPSNVLVVEEAGDSIGRPKVLDFGIARIAEAEMTDGIETTVGTLLGTVPYMSPEQSTGDPESVGHLSDIYTLGVIAYELLSGRMPYDVKGRPVALALRSIRNEEPTRLSRLASQLPGDIEHVVAQALEKEPSRRYANAAEFAADLRAAASGRPVQARAPGIVRRTRKWARQHPIAAAVLGTGTLALGVLALLGWQAETARVQAERQAQSAREREVEARDRLVELERERSSLLLLADREELERLSNRAEELWPMRPEQEDALAEWVERAEAVVAHTDRHRAALAETEVPSSGAAAYERTWWRDSQTDLVAELEAFAQPNGLLEGVRRRHLRASTLRERTLVDPMEAWTNTIAAIADSPRYGGLELVPQLGLVPLGPDPESGLFEFWHVASGDVPLRDEATGLLTIAPETGIVLVLIPKGTFLMGAQNVDASAPGFDPDAGNDEAPAHEVTVSAYFLSKYELTQGQWKRVHSSNPSLYQGDLRCLEEPVDDSYPVETVSWLEAARATARLDLRLPTEAEWERAVRANTDTPWSTGDQPESLDGYANVSDQAYREFEGIAQNESYELWNDGYPCPAPVGTYRANPFGLHDMHGNLWEWCRDYYAGAGYANSPKVDPLFDADDSSREYRMIRGGCFQTDATLARSTTRFFYNPFDVRNASTGLRPARSIRAPE